jgi:hypothetical protein
MRNSFTVSVIKAEGMRPLGGLGVDVYGNFILKRILEKQGVGM